MTTEPTIGTIAFTRFKSLVNQTIELRSLTVLTGENSAGKSSVIQALRLLAQASRSSASAGSPDLFPFSGPEFNAGTWDELITDNRSEAGETRTIGLALTVNEPQDRKGGTAIWAVELSNGDVTQGARLERVELGYFRGERSDLIQLRTRGDGSSSLSRDRADEAAWRRSKLYEDAIGNRRLRGPRRLSRHPLGVDSEPPRFTAKAYSNSKSMSPVDPWSAAETQSESHPTLQLEPGNREPFTLQAEITFAETQTGLEPSLFVAADGSEELVVAWLSLFDRLDSSRPAREQTTRPGATGTVEIPEHSELPDNFLPAVADGFQAWLDRLGAVDGLIPADVESLPEIQDGDLEPAVATALKSVLFWNADTERRIKHGLAPGEANFNPALIRRRWAARRSDTGEAASGGGSVLNDQDVVDYLCSAVRDKPEGRLVFELSEHGRDSRFFTSQIYRSSGLVASVLADRVHYLGPLRTASSLYSATVPTGLVATLGASGEYTAAILDRYRDTTVVCPLPPGGTSEMSLLEAVGLWLAEFGVAAGAETTHHGKAGVRISFADANTNMMRDPTELGVGASQVLPVVVLCLLAKPGDVVMIEQPELHLHPRPQQILGDFLIAIARSGRQVIAETHSDHVVNRIRRRVAEDEDDHVRKLTRVLFAQRVANDEHGSETRFTRLDVNEFGAFDEWPDGFFDEARDDLAVIARAAAARARAVIDNGSRPPT